MYKKLFTSFFIFLSIAIPYQTPCSDMRDYYPKKGVVLNPLINFRTIKALERKVKNSACKIQSLQTDLAQALITIASQENYIKQHEARINSLEKLMQQAHDSIEENAINIGIVTEDVADITKNITVITEHAQEIENNKESISKLHYTCKNRFEDIDDEMNEIQNKIESSPYQNKKRPISPVNSPIQFYSRALSPAKEYEDYGPESPFKAAPADHNNKDVEQSSFMKALSETMSGTKKPKI